MSEEIKLERVIQVIVRHWEQHGFQLEDLERQLNFLYRLGWSMGFDDGMRSFREIKDTVEGEEK